MAFKHKFTLMCDEIRQENNGKFILLGMYTPNIAVNSLPSVIPSLTFLTWLEADHVGGYTQKINLQSLESGKIMASATSMLQVQAQPGQAAPPWNVLSAVNFRNIMFDRAGTYHFTLTIEGQPEPIIHQFDVVLALPAPIGIPGMHVR